MKKTSAEEKKCKMVPYSCQEEKNPGERVWNIFFILSDKIEKWWFEILTKQGVNFYRGCINNLKYTVSVNWG